MHSAGEVTSIVSSEADRTHSPLPKQGNWAETKYFFKSI